MYRKLIGVVAWEQRGLINIVFESTFEFKRNVQMSGDEAPLQRSSSRG